MTSMPDWQDIGKLIETKLTQLTLVFFFFFFFFSFWLFFVIAMLSTVAVISGAGTCGSVIFDRRFDFGTRIP